MARLRYYVLALLLLVPTACARAAAPEMVTTSDRQTLETLVGKWVTLQGRVLFWQGRVVLETSGQPVLLDSWRGATWVADGSEVQFTGILRLADGPARQVDGAELRFRLEQPEPFIDFKGIGYSILESLLGLFPFWSLMLGAAWLWTCIATKPAQQGGRRRVFLLGCLPPFAIPVAIVTIGIVLAANPGAKPPPYPVQLINGLLLSHIPLAGLLLWRWRRHWLAVLASSLFAAYLCFVASFYSTMSVKGTWL
ncbi:MAG TPA: hypothetical protein VFA18_11020 [Gemmataceae bacterium]|nr:hypothetical protein [Gemmataceae bacterium]